MPVHGFVMSESAIEKIKQHHSSDGWRSKVSSESKNRWKDPEFRKRMSEALKKSWTKERYERCSGANNPSWKGGNKSPNREARRRFDKTRKAKDWRKAVMDRDMWTCVDCGAQGNQLHAHHILSWSACQERRLDVSNGVTLCGQCHLRRHAESDC
jgi:hypothetical protein